MSSAYFQILRYMEVRRYLHVLSLKTLVTSSVALSAVLAVIAFLYHDWMWLIIDIICVVLLVLPHVRDLGYYYNRNIAGMTMLAPVLALVLHVANYYMSFEAELFWQVNLYTYLTSAIQAYQCFILGFMLAILMDRSFNLVMTIPWMVVFALTFAMTLSALDMFFTFGVLYAEGYPVFNSDFYDADRYTNSILMATPVASTVVTAILTVLMMIRGRGKDKDFFIAGEADA